MSHHAPSRLYDLREWLLDRIDGGEEMRGEDGLVSDFIRQIDAQDAELAERMDVAARWHTAAAPYVTPMALYEALRAMSPPSEIAEPRGCPTPGSCSAVEELADLKQRLLPLHADFARTLERELNDLKQRILPQFQGRAQRAEHERDALLEQLIEARSAIQQAYGCLWRYTGSSNPMFLQARKMLLARLTTEQQAIGIRYANKLFGPTTEHEILHSDCSHDAAPSATAAPPEEIDELGKYDDKPCGEGITLRRQWWSGGTWLEKGDRVVVLRPRMKGQPDRPDWARQLPGAEIFDRDHGYDRTASLNAGHYVCLCGGACSRPDARHESPHKEK
jgi:hypothetical protein